MFKRFLVTVMLIPAPTWGACVVSQGTDTMTVMVGKQSVEAADCPGGDSFRHAFVSSLNAALENGAQQRRPKGQPSVREEAREKRFRSQHVPNRIIR